MAKNILTIVCVCALTFFSGCSKEEEPEPPVTTKEIQPINFGSATFGSVDDIDGNTYKTVVIGTATWMAENLKTTKFKNGDPIQKLPAGSGWTSATIPAYYAYGDNPDLIPVYGHLYNGYAKNDDRGVCPSGWHVATTGDWITIGNTLGGEAVAGDKMKEQGTSHWITANNSNNESGFTGVPGGSMFQGRLTDLGRDGYWWSTSTGDFFYLTNVEVNLRHKNTAVISEGLSIRCVKD